MKEHWVVAISRQYGSGGREIGALVARQLGLPLYDKKIVLLAAEESGMSRALLEEPARDCVHPPLWDVTPGLTFALPVSDSVYLAQRAALVKLALAGPCVIVGRGGGEALRGRVPLLSVFIYAAPEERRRRAVEEYGDPAEKIDARIAAIDKRREAYFRFYSGVSGRRMENYHLCIDSGAVGVEGAAELIVSALEHLSRGALEPS